MECRYERVEESGAPVYRDQEGCGNVGEKEQREVFQVFRILPVAREYLKKRGVNEDTIKTFRLGYSLESWDDLLTNAKKDGYKPEDDCHS